MGRRVNRRVFEPSGTIGLYAILPQIATENGS